MAQSQAALPSDRLERSILSPALPGQDGPPAEGGQENIVQVL